MTITVKLGAEVDGLQKIDSAESVALDIIQPSSCGSTRTDFLMDLDFLSIEPSVVASGGTHEAEDVG